MIYLDNASTSKVEPEVAEVIYESLKNDFANPSSLYSAGALAEMEMNRERRLIASCIGAKGSEIHFTSSATESDNIAIYGLALARKNWGKRIIATGYEHPSVSGPFAFLSELGYERVKILPGKDGTIDDRQILSAVDKSTCLVSLIHVNNETGALLDAERISALIKEKNPRTRIHLDAVQSFMKLPLDVKRLKIDSLAFSAHKIGGPKGIGGLYVKSGTNLKPVLLGGGQEGGLRAGTENIHYIKGFAKACELLKPSIEKNLSLYRQLNKKLRDGLKEFRNVEINSPGDSVPYTLNFSFMGYRSETLLHFLDGEGICVSSGSACSKGAPSYTLTRMGLGKDRIDSAIRVSFGPENTPGDVDALLYALGKAKEQLQKVKKR